MERASFSVLAACALSCVFTLSTDHFQFIYERKNWTEAQRFCRDRYTDLVTIETPEALRTLNKLADLSKMEDDQLFWVGLYDDVNSWKWLQSDKDPDEGEEMQFTNWKMEEPNNLHGNELCGEMDDHGHWNDVSCSRTMKPICSTVRGQSRTFVFINLTMNWTQAQSFCREHHTELARARNMAENQEIKDVIPAGEYGWIGLFRDAWKWSDGRKSSFKRWKKDKPDNSGKKDECAAADMKASGGWEDGNCDTERAFVCYGAAVKQVVRLKLQKTSSLDLDDPAVLEDLLRQLQLRLKQQEVDGDVRLSWRRRSDGKVFLKDEDVTKKRRRRSTAEKTDEL